MAVNYEKMFQLHQSMVQILEQERADIIQNAIDTRDPNVLRVWVSACLNEARSVAEASIDKQTIYEMFMLCALGKELLKTALECQPDKKK